MNLENTKVYTRNPKIIRKYAELCGVSEEAYQASIEFRHHENSKGVCFLKGKFWMFSSGMDVDLNYKCDLKTITPDQINTLYDEKFGRVGTPEWNGKGLPPIGAECRYFVANPYSFKDNHLRKMTCVAHVGVNNDLAVLVSDDYKFCTVCNNEWIRPVETESQRKQREFAEKWLKRFQEGDCSIEDILNGVYKEFHQGE